MSEAPLEKECQSSTRIRISHDLARLELDRPVSLFLADSAANGFRIGRSGDGDGVGDLRLLCQSLGLSGPDEFAIPVAEWEAHKAVRSLSTPALTRPDVKRAAAGDGGINGARPTPLLKPPPPMVLPVVCRAGSTWDTLRSFAPDETQHARASRSARGFGHQDAVDEDEEEAAVSEDIRLGH
jgi:mitogen-activated protein kinase kinase kinase 1